MKGKAVIFPGMGYTKDRPLLYYAGKIAVQNGYELVHIDFGDLKWSKESLSDKAFMIEAIDKCLRMAEDKLQGKDLLSADTLFISKSIGTVVAAAYAKKHSLAPRNVYFSPLVQFGSFVQEKSGIVFYGNADPYADYQLIEEIARSNMLELHRVQGGNHSLETGEVLEDVRSLYVMLQRVEDVVRDRQIYDFTAPVVGAQAKSLSDYRGKVLLIVNSATGCGFTPQYEALERMYRTYREDGFAILDFPCNQFGSQAPGSSTEIHSFCRARYDVSFDQFAKVDVNGENELELFSFLKAKQGFHGFGQSKEAEFLRKKISAEHPDYEFTSDIKWNFTKFLVTRDGEVTARFEPTERMEDVEAAVRGQLGLD